MPPASGSGSTADHDAETRGGSSRKKVLIVGGAIVLVLVLAAAAVGAALVLGSSEDSAEDQYVSAIYGANLDEQFASDRAAVIQGEAFCEEANTTGEPSGGEAEQLAVEYLCPEWEDDFQLLSTITVEGTFEVVDIDEYLLSDDGGSCEGEGGFGDINASTAVIVTNTGGDVLDRSDLGPGSVEDGSCLFEFEFEVTEGEDDYIVAVGDRGETSNSFEELESQGIDLTLGG